MASKDDLMAALNGWINKLSNPDIAAEFEGYNRTFQLIYPDINVNLQLIFNGPTAKVIEGFNENAEMSLDISSDMFMGIISGDEDPMELFMEGVLKPKGNMSDLEKLEIFLDED